MYVASDFGKQLSNITQQETVKSLVGFSISAIHFLLKVCVTLERTFYSAWRLP